MKSNLHITLVQSSLHWENIPANLAMFSEKLDGIKEGTDLVVLPEMFSTGFSMRPELFAETMDGSVMHWMSDTAKRKNTVICGSAMIRDEDKYYNRLLWMRPDGSYEYYDKRHLFGLGDEHQHFTAGTRRLTVDLNGWKILPLVCYDLRFPVWARNTDGYDVLLFVANWPERRINAWKLLLEARAIENQCYVVGVNRVGNDGNDIYHPGESCVVDPLGIKLWSISNHESMKSVELNYQFLHGIRQSLPFLKDLDAFELKI